MLLGKEQILNAKDLTHQDVEVKEWGGTVRVRVMTGAERDAFEQSVFKNKGKDGDLNTKLYRSKLLVATVVDESNNRLFTEKDIEALGEKSSVPVDKLATAAMKVNGLFASDVEEVIKN